MLHSSRFNLVRNPRKEEKERLKQAFFTVISGLQTALKLINGISGAAGIGPPGLQAGLTGLLFVLNAIQVSVDCTSWCRQDQNAI
jgi:hypothetical protein